MTDAGPSRGPVAEQDARDTAAAVPSTGQPDVDAALARLTAVEGRSTSDSVEIYAAISAALAAALEEAATAEHRGRPSGGGGG